MDKRMFCGTGVIVAVVCLWTALAVSAQPPVVWSTQFGTATGTGGSRVVTDSSNSVWIAGGTRGTLFGAPTVDDGFYVARYDSEGTRLWGKQFATEVDSDNVEGIAIDADDNLYVVGWTDGTLFPPSVGCRDGFVVKLSPDGTVLWSKQFGTVGTNDTDQAHGVAVDGYGNVYVTGETTGRMHGSGPVTGRGNLFITKYNKDGDQLWGKQFGNDYGAMGRGVAVDKLGSVVVVGETHDLFRPVPADRGFEADSFILKLSSSGSQLWGTQFGTSDEDGAIAVRTDNDRNALMAGTMNFARERDLETISGYVAKYGANGNRMWLNELTAGLTEVLGMTVDQRGNVYAVGYTAGSLFGTNAGEEDAFIVVYDPDGNTIWSHQFGTSAFDQANGVSVDTAGRIVIAGTTHSNLFGTNTGRGDAYIMVLPALPVAANPSFDPPGGTYSTAQSLTITTTTDGATIRYTTDGSNPTISSIEYTAPVAITGTTTIKAKVFKNGLVPSRVRSAKYVIGK